MKPRHTALAAGAMAMILSVTALSSTAAAQTNPVPRPGPQLQPRLQAPIGHRQPEPQDLPPNVLRGEGGRTLEQTDLDKKLQICRRC